MGKGRSRISRTWCNSHGKLLQTAHRLQRLLVVHLAVHWTVGSRTMARTGERSRQCSRTSRVGSELGRPLTVLGRANSRTMHAAGILLMDRTARWHERLRVMLHGH